MWCSWTLFMYPKCLSHAFLSQLPRNRNKTPSAWFSEILTIYLCNCIPRQLQMPNSSEKSYSTSCQPSKLKRKYCLGAFITQWTNINPKFSNNCCFLAITNIISAIISWLTAHIDYPIWGDVIRRHYFPSCPTQ